MSSDKIPIISEKKYTYKGIFDIQHTYSFLKSFLENSRHYDLSEKDYEEKNDNGEKMIMTKIEAEQEYTDYYKVIIKYELKMEGKDVEVNLNGQKKLLTKGTATIKVNSYIVPDFQGKRPKGAFATFIHKIYDKYVGKDELSACIGSSAKDVGELIARFKQTVNATIK